MEKTPLIVVVGPTASGKTSFAIDLALKNNAEIISFDSMQIYKELSISTAKPTDDERLKVKHHLIDFVSVTEEYSVAKFCEDAKKKIDEIRYNNKNVVLVGGTGLYIDSLVNNVDFSADNTDDILRKKLEEEAKIKGNNYLYKKLVELDNNAAQAIHPNNTKRIVRALEIYYKSGLTKSQQEEFSRRNDSPYNAIYFGLNYSNRQLLYDRIDKRVDLMLENGLIDEVKAFYKIDNIKTGIQAIGCKELKPYLDGVLTLEECVENLKRESRRYAKRQLTWFRRNKNINWFNMDENTYEKALESANDLLYNFLNRGDID